MNISQSAYKTLTHMWWTLKITYGLLFVIAGADKFTNIVVHWAKYLNGIFPEAVGLDGVRFMYGVGIIEIIIGLLILSRFTKIGAYLAAGWFIIIVFDLLSTMAFYDIAVRDLVLAIGAHALAKLTSVKEEITI